MPRSALISIFVGGGEGFLKLKSLEVPRSAQITIFLGGEGGYSETEKSKCQDL